MPLVILCGAPCSGKSDAAHKMYNFLTKKGKDNENFGNVVIVEEDLTEPDEKKRRANFLGSVERSLKKDTIVIADGTNNIKGFRYQLYCLARAISTPHTVVFCSKNGKEEWKEMEPPNNNNRWDFPLLYFNDDEEFYSSLLSVIQSCVQRKPSLATIIPEKTSLLTPQYLSRLEQECSSVIQHLQLQLNDHVMQIDGLKLEEEYRTFGELNNAKRQFMILAKSKAIPIEEARKLFISYLNKGL